MEQTKNRSAMRPLSGKTMSFSRVAEAYDAELTLELELQKSRWLERLRWLAVVAQVCCGGLGLHYGLLQPDDLPAYLVVVSLLATFNLFWSKFRHRISSANVMPTVFLEMALDLFTLGFLLSMTGGCMNPLFALLYLHAALGPLMLKGVWSKLYLLTIAVCLASICLSTELVNHGGQFGQNLPKQLKLAAELFVVFVIWALTHWFSTALDRLKQTIANLQRQKQRGDHLRALGAMAASFSHEFSTPLNTAKIRIERVARRNAQLNHDNDFKASVDALDQCESILKGLFDSDQLIAAARLDAIDLVSFVSRICASWQESQPDTKLVMKKPENYSEIACRVPKMVLARSIVDLLDNAAQALDDANRLIEVSVSREKDQAHVLIADRGRGLTHFVKERMGDPFLSTRADGVGLGLFTAIAMMEALGGLLRVDDREHGGTIVTLQFPVS